MRILPAGDRALVAEFGSRIDEDINRRVHALDRWLEAQRLPGIIETVPTFRSLLICYDPERITYRRLQRLLERFDETAATAEQTKRRLLIVPCCYGGEHGPDLAELARLKGLSEQELIRLHSGTDYPVYMLGFLPGFVYLGGLDPRLEAARLASPRKAIPAGSVGIGGSQTGVYPMESPGGWRLIGRTPIPFYRPGAEHPVLCSAGQLLRFVPIRPRVYEAIAESVRRGTWQPEYSEEGTDV